MAFSSKTGSQGRHCRERRSALAAGLEHKGFDIVQRAFAPQGGGRIEDAARHRRPSRFLGVGCTEEGIVDRRCLVFGWFSQGFRKVFGEKLPF